MAKVVQWKFILPYESKVPVISFLRPVYTGDFCRSNSMQFLSHLNGIRFQTCSKPLRYRGDKSHLVYTCDFEAATLARQKLHRVAATKIACIKGPLRLSVYVKIRHFGLNKRAKRTAFQKRKVLGETYS